MLRLLYTLRGPNIEYHVHMCMSRTMNHMQEIIKRIMFFLEATLDS